MTSQTTGPRNFKYQVIEVPAPFRGGNAAWRIINTRRNKAVSTHTSKDEAFREVQMILADEAHPNF